MDTFKLIYEVGVALHLVFLKSTLMSPRSSRRQEVVDTGQAGICGSQSCFAYSSYIFTF